MRSAARLAFALLLASYGDAAAPNFVSYTATVFNTTTTPKTTANIAVTSGDTLVAIAGNEDSNVQTIAITDSQTLTWTLQNSYASTSGICAAYIWTATAGSTGNMTVTFTATGSSKHFGGGVYDFNGTAGIGATGKSTSASGAPSLSLTTTVNNSAIVVVNADFAAKSGARTWRTVNSITPTAGNGLEKTYVQDGVRYTIYSAYWNDAGTAAADTVGLSAPTAQTYSLIGVEVKASAAAGGAAQQLPMTGVGAMLRPVPTMRQWMRAWFAGIGGRNASPAF